METDHPYQQRQDYLIWVDMEMTGLNPDSDQILELAMVITDNDLRPLIELPVMVIHHPDSVLEGMDEWNTRTHTRTGLWKRVQDSSHTLAQAQQQLLSCLETHFAPNASPMCGNSICQDRRFMARYMPQLEQFFHYRNLDVSTLKELAKRWRSGLPKHFAKKGRHTALADVYESIAELDFYRQNFLKLDAEELR